LGAVVLGEAAVHDVPAPGELVVNVGDDEAACGGEEENGENPKGINRIRLFSLISYLVRFLRCYLPPDKGGLHGSLDGCGGHVV
jgi:hypothetical protein